MTNRDPETAVLITAEKLNAMADSIAKSIEVFREAAEIAHEKKGLATFSVKSGEAAVERSHSFARALEKAIYAAKSNQPFIVGDLKPRSTAKKQAREELLAHSKDVLKKHQQAAKKAKKKE